MFGNEFEAAANAAAGKVAFLKKNSVGYFAMAMMAGAYVGFGVILAFTCGGLLTGQPYAKIIMGATFAAALSLVVMAGSELFTGNNFVIATGMMKKKITIAEGVKLWVICYIGNLVGSVVLALIYNLTGASSGAVGETMASIAATKMSIAPLALFTRGILCNILVCLAVWCGFRMKTESGKLIMIFWCIIAFFTPGFEHSVANMTALTIGLLNPCGQAITMGGFVYNLVIVTIGNMVGGILFTAVPYFLSAKEK